MDCNDCNNCNTCNNCDNRNDCMNCDECNNRGDCKNCNEICSCGCGNKRPSCACTCKYEFDLKECNNNNANQATQEELLEQLKCYRFAIIELGLYLDTHPDDEKALCLHNEYAKRFKMLENQYQRIYGPLSIMYPCKKWRWLEEPWPWEGGKC